MLKGQKAAKLADDEFWIFEFHCEIYWEMVEMLGYIDGTECPKCNQLTMYMLKDNFALRCYKCKSSLSPMAKTIFNNSKMYLPIWLKAIKLVMVEPTIRLHVLMKKLNCTNVTACNIRRKIKTLTTNSVEFKLMKKFEKQVTKLLK